MKSNVLPLEFTTSEKITFDYINHTGNLNRIFPRHFRELKVRECNIDRQRIVDRLLEYNCGINAPKRVIENIESIYQPETYAVITGQQPGLFSGPLYTVYKAISAIVICEKLSDRKHSLVPIFWNASEDHDLSEVDHINMFRENEPFEIRYDSGSRDVAFSHMNLDRIELKDMSATVEDVSPNSEFKAVLMRDITGIIQDSSTVGDFFSRFMIYLFGEFGLVMTEPHSLRDLMTPVFDRLIRRPTECTKILNEAGQKLRKLGYSPRIHKKPNICNFFLLDEEGKRLRVTFDGNFRVANETFSQSELLHMLDDNPFRFSANAVTRSITQDFLLPTFAYVAGPNEIAYQAQIKGLYDLFSLEMPVIFPRFGATIVEKKISKVLRKYDLEVHELMNPEKLMKKLAREKIDDVLRSFKSDVLRSMAEVTRQAESIDKSLIGPCSLAKGRILKTIEVMEDKITSKLKAHDQAMRRQITKAHNNLFPYGKLQERQINVLEYLIKFGKGFLKTVYENFLAADYGEHRVIEC